MKAIKLIPIMLFAMSCKAQIILPLYEADFMDPPSNTYYKDIANDYDKFVGTWKWQQGLSSFTITLLERPHVFVPDDGCYSDLLIGEYQYINASGTTIVNTLPQLSTIGIIPYQRHIWGNFLIRPKNNLSEAGLEHRRVKLLFEDPERMHLHSMITLRYIEGTNPQQIDVFLTGEFGGLIEQGLPLNSRIPNGHYLMTKQP